MNYIKSYFNSVVKYDLINKFYYTILDKIPEVHKIIVAFRLKGLNVKQLSATLLALELITSKKGRFIVARKGNLFLKIRKGFPTGCKVILQKKEMYVHLSKLIDEMFSKTKTSLKINKTKRSNIIFYKLNDSPLFIEIEHNYNLFNSILTNITITVIGKKVSQKGFFYLIESFKQPLSSNKSRSVLLRKHNSIGRV